MRNVLAVRGLEKRYGSVQALKGVDLEVGEGELFGLLGPNGAGKSTLVKLLAKMYEPASGSIFVDDTPLARIAANTLRARLELASMCLTPPAQAIVSTPAFCTAIYAACRWIRACAAAISAAGSRPPRGPG